MNTKFISNYGCRGVWNIGYECEFGNIHVNNKYLIVDTVYETNNIIHGENEIGKVIITSTINHIFPIIKYHIGDYARLIRNHDCLCKNSSPIIVLENGKEFEKIGYSEFYGNDLFKRVLRAMYFHENVRDFDDIKITQKDYLFNIYVKGKLTDDFKNKFRHISNFLLNSKTYTYSFHCVPDFGFLKMRSGEIDFIFKRLTN